MSSIKAFEAAFPGVEYTQQGEICTWWGDFRQNRYEQGDFVIGHYPIEDPSSVSVFNGDESTKAYPAVRNGIVGRFVRTSFSPDFGHASYGQASFEPL